MLFGTGVITGEHGVHGRRLGFYTKKPTRLCRIGRFHRLRGLGFLDTWPCGLIDVNCIHVYYRYDEDRATKDRSPTSVEALVVT